MKTIISQATKNDIDFMLEMDKLNFEDYIIGLDGSFDETKWRRHLNDDLPRAFVMKKHDQSIGYFRYSVIDENSEKHAYLRVIAIKPDQQGHGYGYTLYQYFESLVSGLNIETIKLSCPLSSNAHDWYPKLGFHLTEEKDLAKCFEKQMS
ncbi:MAG: GNAT family N-acetyltransferase [bacterium]|nr:GNAT family N-acetyltransferase [bacterium]MBU1919170.1 GNAT family N-acetyltransferase [bacterium]